MSNQTLRASSSKLVSTVKLAAFITLATLFSSPVRAITLVQDRNALQSNDQIEWSSLGKVLNPFAPNPSDFLPYSFSGQSSHGLGISVNIPSAGGDITPPFIFQNNPPIQTNFAPGDFLLFTGFSPTVVPTGNPNPLTIFFDKNVKAAGTQIAASGSENIDYEVFISAFDDGNNLLGTFSIPGISSGTRDNSAVFLGVTSDTANIKSLVFNTSSPQRGFGINRVSITTVNEPYTGFSLLIFGALGLCLKGYKFDQRKLKLGLTQIKKPYS
ncbi:hypothetical protein ACSQ6I_16005 [Anabaena sp. WFMT]|uniref:hypothetical protein n=1 Tax=Anabaena sp. WFMT TaxID=3449730 RepID=UPI003F25D8D2